MVVHPPRRPRANAVQLRTAIVAALETEGEVTETVLRGVNDLVQVLMDTPVVAD